MWRMGKCFEYRTAGSTKFVTSSFNMSLCFLFRYCNHRIMVFTSKGSYITQYSAPIDGVSLQVPHSLALSSNGTKLYVADRENYRIVEYDTLTGNGKTFMPINKLGGAIYAITFSDRSGHWPMYAVNGSMDAQKKAVGFTIDERGEVIDTWSPHDRVSGCGFI